MGQSLDPAADHARASGHLVRSQSVSNAAHRLQIAGRLGVGLDLTPKPRHLHVHCAAGGIDGAVGQLHAPDLLQYGSSKCPFFVAEKLALQQPGGNRGAIEVIIYLAK